MSGLDTIHHIALTVADIDDSVRWYQTSFSCEVIHQEARLAILQFANIQLTLVLPSLQNTHIAYIRDDAETLGELREQVDGSQSTFVADPTGNPVEIVCSKSLGKE